MKKTYFYFALIISVFISSCGNSTKNSDNDESSITEEVEEEKWEDCQNCNGRGYFTHQCSTCDGSGRIKTTITRTDTRTCPSCYGTGLAPCTTCGNNGYFQ